MTSDLQVQWVSTPTLMTLLEARIRPEFRPAVIVPTIGAPVIGDVGCCVPGCARVRKGLGLCMAHLARWNSQGRPPAEQWSRSTNPVIRGNGVLRMCAVTGCGREGSRHRLCNRHVIRWKRAGSPPQEDWLAGDTGAPLARKPACLVETCDIQGGGSTGLCRCHLDRWEYNGKPPIAEFVEMCGFYGVGKFDLRGLSPQLRLEFQYALQCRVDEGRTHTPPYQLRGLLRVLSLAHIDSLLETPLEPLLDQLRRGDFAVGRRFLTDAVNHLRDLVEGIGWDHEYHRDVWLLRRLGFRHESAALHFEGIEPVWLRELAKRHVRWRLSTVSVGTAVHDLRALTILAEDPRLVAGPQALTREVLENYLARLKSQLPNAKSRGKLIRCVGTFLKTAQRLDWTPRLPRDAQLYREDYPRLDQPLPRGLSEFVMAQLETTEALTKFPHPTGRVLAEILMRAGLRRGDACHLAIDCLRRDPQGAPYLHYRNRKMNRDALVPIDDALAATIAAQQATVLSRYPGAKFLLLSILRNPDGVLPYCEGSFGGQLRSWLLTLDARDELGRPAQVTAHRWRHTYATRLVNSDVPQEVVRRLLDHTSTDMTALYARLSDRTIRDNWERARKVDVRGELVVFDPNSPLADAIWMKENLGRAKMALPNGYCGLPLQQSCPHANACLTCPLFLTTPDFLPEHHRHLQATEHLIAAAEQNGQARLVEMNQAVADNLTRIITTLEAPVESGRRGTCACDSVADACCKSSSGSGDPSRRDAPRAC